MRNSQLIISQTKKHSGISTDSVGVDPVNLTVFKIYQIFNKVRLYLFPFPTIIFEFFKKVHQSIFMLDFGFFWFESKIYSQVRFFSWLHWHVCGLEIKKLEINLQFKFILKGRLIKIRYNKCLNLSSSSVTLRILVILV